MDIPRTLVTNKSIKHLNEMDSAEPVQIEANSLTVNVYIEIQTVPVKTKTLMPHTQIHMTKKAPQLFILIHFYSRIQPKAVTFMMSAMAPKNKTLQSCCKEYFYACFLLLQ